VIKMSEKLIKKLKFQVNHTFNEIVIKSKSEWANDDIVYFTRFLKEMGAEEVEIKK